MDNRDKLYKNTKEQTGVQKELTPAEKKANMETDKLAVALSSITESNMIADETLKELKKNTESINRSRNLATNVSAQTDVAGKSLGRIERRRKYFGFFDWIF